MSDEGRKKADDWDWVSERGQCSPLAMLDRLVVIAKDNCAKRNGQLEQALGRAVLRFEVPTTNEPDAFAVWDSANNAKRRTVTFRAVGDSIVVRQSWVTEEASYRLGLDPTGDCRLESAGVAYQPWQVMFRALESLFFEG
jgi:hypothetical protein